VPVPAETAIANVPQKVTRIAAFRIGSPPAFALIAPKTASEARETTPIAAAMLPIGVTRAVKNGSAVPTAKYAADADAASTGRAAIVFDVPNSSRACAATASPSPSQTGGKARHGDLTSGGDQRAPALAAAVEARGAGR
jgi:hypothetical protein